ncbi:MAG: thiamine phosphate synthase [Brevundimonas sp.]|nr:MAG: thiamine phosphate synthase [Brevundimonas sp.]
MNRSDAEILWEVASVLARDAAKVSRADGRTRPAPPPILFFTDPDRTPCPWETAARLPAGSGVIYRSFGAPDARDTALRLREATRARGVRLLIGLDADLAETCGADGVHLPERALDQAEALSAARPDWLLTGAAHDRAALGRCGGLDAAVVSPVFPAGGASADRPALGVETLTHWIADAPCPVIALGGMTTKNARSLIGSGACGLAGVAAIQSAFGPD